MKTYYIIAFVIMSVIQAYMPVSMILQQEVILKDGKLYKFKCRPVDPNDPFRGKFVALDFEAATYKTDISAFTNGQTIFVLLEKDNEGFAKISRVSADGFATGDYFSATVRYTMPETLVLEFPFNRYYMEESKSQAAEDVYREKSSEAVAHVYVKDGNAVLNKVMIGNKTIEEAAQDFKNSPSYREN